MNGFLSMIYSAVEKSMTIKTDALVMRTINNMIAETLNADKTAFGWVQTTNEKINYASASTVRCVNLLKLYNDKTGAHLTADVAVTTPDFIRFAAYTMGLYADRLQTISTLFNVGGKERFTPKDVLHTVLLSDFAAAAKHTCMPTHSTARTFCCHRLRPLQVGKQRAQITTLQTFQRLT